MWIYEKKLEFPVHIKEPNPKLAQLIISQYGGPDGEAGASFRYLSQRYSMKDRRVAGVLTDVGTEELAHLEIVGAMVHQLTRDLTPEEIEKSGFAPYYVDHTLGVWPQAAGGIPFNACEFQVKGEKKPLTAKFYGTDKKLPIRNRQEMDEILKSLEDCKYEITEVKKGERIKNAPDRGLHPRQDRHHCHHSLPALAHQR